jgi:AraC family transcriptional regulator
VTSLEPGRFFGRRKRQAAVRGFTLTECRYRSGERLPRHQHGEPFLSLVVGGAYEESAEGQARNCAAGAVVFHPLTEVHSERIAGCGAHILNISLHGDSCARLAELPLSERPVAGVHRGPVGATAFRLLAEFLEGPRASPLALEGLALTILAECCPRGGRERGRPPRWLGDVLDLLRSAVPRRTSLTEVADQVGVHPTHLARVFKRHAGETLGEHVRRLRVEWARNELVRAARPLVEIALDAGFADQAHFCRTFRRLTGSTPAAYRRERTR